MDAPEYRAFRCMREERRALAAAAEIKNAHHNVHH